MDNSSSTDVKPNGVASRSRSFDKASCEEKRTENVEVSPRSSLPDLWHYLLED
jgi:hypothetical protein